MSANNSTQNRALKHTQEQPIMLKKESYDKATAQAETIVSGYLHTEFGREKRLKDVCDIIYEYIFQQYHQEIWNHQLINTSYIQQCIMPFTAIKRIRAFNGIWCNVFGSVTTTKALSQGKTMKEYIWRLRYKSNNIMDDTMDAMIGIVKHSEIERLSDSNYYCFYEKCAYGMTSNGISVNGGQFKNYSGVPLKSGDVITMRVRYEQSNVRVSFSVNGKVYDYEEIAHYVEIDEYNLAISLNDKDTVINIESFEVY